jgi:ferritin-like protein
VTAPNEIQITEHELIVMTKELDEVHHATLPQMRDSVAELQEQLRSGVDKVGATVASRRKFLMGTGAVMAAGVLAACSSSKSSSSSAATATTAAAAAGSSGSGTGQLTGDLAVAALAASLENLAVATYGAALSAATAGKLGTVPPAVATFATTAQSQHKDHAAAWNAILTAAGKPAVSGVDTTVNTGVIQPAFAKVTTIVEAAQLALQLEQVAAATYLNAIENALTSTGGIATSASIQPVEMQHIAILLYVLGMYPVPDSFASTTGARPLSDQIG